MTADIKPVAWMSDDGRPFKSESMARRNSWNNASPLYSQATIDALQAEVDDANDDFRVMEELALSHKARAERAEAEVEALRNLAGCAYQFAGIHDAPEAWLDALSNAASGEPFTCDGLLPYIPDAAREGRE